MKRTPAVLLLSTLITGSLLGTGLAASADEPTPSAPSITSNPTAPQPSASADHPDPDRSDPSGTQGTQPDSTTGNTPEQKATPIDEYVAAHPEVGAPTGPETVDANGVRTRTFTNGIVVWSSQTGAHFVHGAIGHAWIVSGAQNSELGLPTNDEWTPSGGGAAQEFQNAVIYWTADTGAQIVKGAIRSEWERMGGSGSSYGFPTTSEIGSANGGVYQIFQGGVMYWSPATGLTPIGGGIGWTWMQFGAANGKLGAPTSGEFGIPGGAQRNFENGAILWSPGSGSHALTGAILSKWNEKGAVGGLGYPMTEETPIRDGGVYQIFQNGTVYWTWGTGAHATGGAIRDYYAGNNWENGRFGYPVSDEICNNAGCYQNYEHGAITWGPTTGAHDLHKLDSRCTWGRAACADKTTNKIYWVVNGQIQATFDARFGAPGYETDDGEMRINRKVANDWSIPFNAPMPYSQYFTYDGKAIHYSSDFERRGFPSWGSHGCINLNAMWQAEWLFNQTAIGDRVVVYRS